jgi:glycosyltransferase involved in cell wall biosynthesis
VTIRFLILNAYSVGGTIRTTLNTAAELSRHHDVEIVSVYRRREAPALSLRPAVHVRALVDLRPRERSRWEAWALTQRSRLIPPEEARYDRFSVLTDVALLRFLRSVGDGVLVGTRPGLNLAIARFARRSVVRVGQDHMNLGSYKPRLRAAIARAYPRLDLVTALTRESAGEYAALLEGRTRVEWVPNAAPDMGGLRADIDATRVVAAGRLVRRKGFGRLLRAWAQVAHEHSGWELWIFGAGPERRRLQALARKLGVDGSVRLAGQTSRMPEELARSSLFAMSSRREGFPMVLLEAMGVGLPVVAFDCPTGPRDIVTDGVDGYVVPNGDVAAFAAGLAELMDDADKRRRFGAAAVRKAGAFENAAIAARWETLLGELSAGKPHERRLDRRLERARR